MNNHLDLIDVGLSPEEDIQASDISPWLAGDTSSLFYYRGADGQNRTVNLHNFRRNLCEPISDALAEVYIHSKQHLCRVIENTGHLAA